MQFRRNRCNARSVPGKGSETLCRFQVQSQPMLYGAARHPHSSLRGSLRNRRWRGHRMTTGNAAIELREVSYTLDSGRDLISQLSLNIARGETLILLGRSGSGKTTSLKLINRMLELTAGEIIIDGRPQSEWDPIRLRRSIGYVMQDAGLFPHWTVEQNVSLVPRLEGWPAARVAERVREMLTLVGLDPREFAARRPRELSGGQRQRI